MSVSTPRHPDHILVTGATGYIGGRLVPRLLNEGYHVRCLVRNPRKLIAKLWLEHPRIEILTGDASDQRRVEEAMRGCTVAYYLIHSMIAVGKKYREHDLELARVFARASEKAGVERIIYLGGLGETGEHLSEHLSSRREIETELESGSVPVTVLRAAMIIGSGSASFEMMRYLVERLPIITPPLSVHTGCQPISVRNVLNYLIQCLSTPETVGRILDIGGPEIITYREIMVLMAEVLGLRRRIIVPVPVLSLRLSAYVISLITPISNRIALPLSEGLRNRVVCRNKDAERMMPQKLLSVREAIEAATVKVRTDSVETAWSDAGSMPGDPDWSGGTVYTNLYSIEIDATPSEVFDEICCIGGKQGYYGADWLWALRGIMDQIVGGPGLRRGRRDSKHIAYGDAVDFWRVTAFEKNRKLELMAEMRLPGDAYLDLDITDGDSSTGSTRLCSTARFRPKGLPGIIYWYAVLPLHRFVFLKMLRGIKKKIERTSVKEIRMDQKPEPVISTSDPDSF